MYEEVPLWNQASRTAAWRTHRSSTVEPLGFRLTVDHQWWFSIETSNRKFRFQIYEMITRNIGTMQHRRHRCDSYGLFYCFIWTFPLTHGVPIRNRLIEAGSIVSSLNRPIAKQARRWTDSEWLNFDYNALPKSNRGSSSAENTPDSPNNLS